MPLPSVTLPGLAFAPRLPSLGARIAFTRAWGAAKNEIERADVEFAALHLCHPAPPWTVPADASVLAMGVTVANWLDTSQVPPVSAWNAADSLAAALLDSLAPPSEKGVSEARDFSPPPVESGTAGGSSSLGSGAATAGDGGT